jgi:diaminopimelate epimerase
MGEKLVFYKMQGAGNDYIFIDATKGMDEEKVKRLIPRLCAPHYGIGGDGVILLTKGNGADIGMKMWNKDGSRGAMCGNGIRCLAHLAYLVGYAGTQQTIQTDSGKKRVSLTLQDGQVIGAEVEMGEPNFALSSIPCTAKKAPLFVEIGDEICFFTPVSMGNPHMTTFVDNLERFHQFDGDALTKNPHFPDGVNVGVAQIVDENALHLRVFERGSGETLACGTGACAAVAVGCHLGYFTRGVPVTVYMRGGDLVVTYQMDGGLTLYGNCPLIYKGEWYGQYLESAF